MNISTLAKTSLLTRCYWYVITVGTPDSLLQLDFALRILDSYFSLVCLQETAIQYSMST
jgi:hypothetical protein